MRIVLIAAVISIACSSKPAPPPTEPMPLPPSRDEVEKAGGQTSDDQLRVTDIDPKTGPAAGGNAVRIRGANFRMVKSVKVRFNKMEADVLRVADDEIVVQAPAGSGGLVADVTVVFDDGSGEMELRGAYTYAQ